MTSNIIREPNKWQVLKNYLRNEGKHLWGGREAASPSPDPRVRELTRSGVDEVEVARSGQSQVDASGNVSGRVWTEPEELSPDGLQQGAAPRAHCKFQMTCTPL